MVAKISTNFSVPISKKENTFIPKKAKIRMIINQVCQGKFEKNPEDEVSETELEVAEEKEGNLSVFISDKVLTNLLVAELIIIKKYIKIYYK